MCTQREEAAMANRTENMAEGRRAVDRDAAPRERVGQVPALRRIGRGSCSHRHCFTSSLHPLRHQTRIGVDRANDATSQVRICPYSSSRCFGFSGRHRSCCTGEARKCEVRPLFRKKRVCWNHSGEERGWAYVNRMAWNISAIRIHKLPHATCM